MSTTAVAERSRWKAVVVPSEHGGWGLTLEPVLLGLLIAPSLAGVAIGVAAFLAFLVRTPLKLALVDARRERWLARSALALQIAVAELIALVALALISTVVSGWAWTVPVAAAVPFVLVQLWFDMRSRSRRLIPELCGATGMAAVAAAIVLAAGRPGRLAVAAWLVLAARSVGAIPFVRVQILRLRKGAADPRTQNLSSACAVLAVVMGAVAVVVDHRLWPGAAGLVAIAMVQTIWGRRPPTVAKVLGMRQMALGFGLVAVAAIGVGALS